MKSWFYIAGISVAVLIVYAALCRLGLALTCAGDGSALFMQIYFSPLSLCHGNIPMRNDLFGLLVDTVFFMLLMSCRYPMGRMVVFVLLAAQYVVIAICVWQSVTDAWYLERLQKVWRILPLDVVSFVVLYLCGQIAIWTLALKKWPR